MSTTLSNLTLNTTGPPKETLQSSSSSTRPQDVYLYNNNISKTISHQPATSPFVARRAFTASSTSPRSTTTNQQNIHPSSTRSLLSTTTAASAVSATGTAATASRPRSIGARSSPRTLAEAEAAGPNQPVIRRSAIAAEKSIPASRSRTPPIPPLSTTTSGLGLSTSSFAQLLKPTDSFTMLATAASNVAASTASVLLLGGGGGGGAIATAAAATPATTAARRQLSLECDYDTSPTELYQAIEAKQWSYIVNMFDQADDDDDDDDDEDIDGGGGANHPTDNSNSKSPKKQQQAAVWVVRKEASGRLRWRLLPIHAAVIFQAPANIVELLLHDFPAGAAAKDDQGMLPLHLALRNPIINWQVVEDLLTAHPTAVFVKDRKGRTPLQGGLAAATAALTQIQKQMQAKSSINISTSPSSAATTIRKSSNGNGIKGGGAVSTAVVTALDTIYPDDHHQHQQHKAAMQALELYISITVAGEKNNWLAEQRLQSEQRMAALSEQHAVRLMQLRDEFTQEQNSLQQYYVEALDRAQHELDKAAHREKALQSSVYDLKRDLERNTSVLQFQAREQEWKRETDALRNMVRTLQHQNGVMAAKLQEFSTHQESTEQERAILLQQITVAYSEAAMHRQKHTTEWKEEYNAIQQQIDEEWKALDQYEANRVEIRRKKAIGSAQHERQEIERFLSDAVYSLAADEQQQNGYKDEEVNEVEGEQEEEDEEEDNLASPQETATSALEDDYDNDSSAGWTALSRVLTSATGTQSRRMTPEEMAARIKALSVEQQTRLSIVIDDEKKEAEDSGTKPTSRNNNTNDACNNDSDSSDVTVAVFTPRSKITFQLPTVTDWKTTLENGSVSRVTSQPSIDAIEQSRENRDTIIGDSTDNDNETPATDTTNNNAPDIITTATTEEMKNLQGFI